jgi:hypothetical protein
MGALGALKKQFVPALQQLFQLQAHIGDMGSQAFAKGQIILIDVVQLQRGFFIVFFQPEVLQLQVGLDAGL